MADARPLHDVFTDLVGAPGAAGDPAALLSDQGHAELPDDLVAEAVVSYADTAPVEVAEHLAPYVAAHSVIGPEPGDPAPGDWAGLLGTAPDVGQDDLDEPVPADDSLPGPDIPAPEFGAGAEAEATTDELELADDPFEAAEPDVLDDPAWEPIEVPAADLTAEVADGEVPDGEDDDPDAGLLG
jgi:hypothetical protein